MSIIVGINRGGSKMAKVSKPKIGVLPSKLRSAGKSLSKRKGRDRSGTVARGRRVTIKVSRLAAHGV